MPARTVPGRAESMSYPMATLPLKMAADADAEVKLLNRTSDPAFVINAGVRDADAVGHQRSTRTDGERRRFQL